MTNFQTLSFFHLASLCQQLIDTKKQTDTWNFQHVISINSSWLRPAYLKFYFCLHNEKSMAIIKSHRKRKKIREKEKKVPAKQKKKPAKCKKISAKDTAK